MKVAAASLLLILLLVTSAAQDTPSSKQAGRAIVAGIVTKDPDGEPVKKVLVELIAENQSEAGNYTALTEPDGTFRIENIVPGSYRLFAEKTGFLDSDKNRGRSDGRLLVLTGGQKLKDLHLRLQAAAVVRGRVTDEDGDPLPNAEVSVLRPTFASGRRHWEQAGGERTNDLGEYRIAGLAAGSVYVSVSPPPDFKTLIETGGGDQSRNSGAQDKSPATSYQTLYYPGTTDRSQATPIQLHSGDDFPVNFSMTPSPSLSIRGSVVNLPPKTSAIIMLQSRDFSLIMNGAEMHKDGSFVIRNVSPGNYTIVATVDGAPVPMTAHQTLQLASANVEGLRLAPQPGATVRGHLRPENKGGRVDFSRMFLMLQSMSGDEDTSDIMTGQQFTNVAHVAEDGSFEWDDVPAGNYYVQLLGENEDWFVKGVQAGGRDAETSGVAINGGAVMMDLVASNNGGLVEGIVVDAKGGSVSDAIVVAVPVAQMRKRLDHFRKTVTDQTGHFTLRGVRSGEYTLFAWEIVDGDAYYDPEFLKSYEGQGTALRVSEGERKTMQVNVTPDGQEQQ